MSRSVMATNLQPKSSVKTCVDSVRQLQSFENDLGLQDRFLSLFTLFKSCISCTAQTFTLHSFFSLKA